MDEKPLHVLVAEALGAENVRQASHNDGWYADWRAGNPFDHEDNCCSECDAHAIANYDTDWSATGPLIERYGFRLRREATNSGEVSNPNELSYVWEARTEDGQWCAEGGSPLVATCNLIVALSVGPVWFGFKQ